MTTDAITFKELNGVEYVYVTKHIQGKPALEVLTGLKEVITSLAFPVTMHWANFDFEYIRPIHWIVALFGAEVVPFTVLDVVTDRKSRGHRFLGEEVTFETADDYLSQMERQFVIADPSKRQQLIVDQIEAIAKRKQLADRS